ncbi:MAG: hypothetical protein ACYTFG_00250 [Planctomycetota bacterium]|jgi:hypothetical protein
MKLTQLCPWSLRDLFHNPVGRKHSTCGVTGSQRDHHRYGYESYSGGISATYEWDPEWLQRMLGASDFSHSRGQSASATAQHVPAASSSDSWGAALRAASRLGPWPLASGSGRSP